VGMNRVITAQAPIESLFPTPVGMNRLLGYFDSTGEAIPHACGDEP